MSGITSASSVDAGPLNVQSITAIASNFPYSNELPLRAWIRTADALQKQAHFYERDGDEQQAYLFMFRHALLALDKLPTHPEAKAPEGRKAISHLQKLANANMVKMADYKPIINQRHERYQQALAKRRSEREQWLREHARNDDEATIARDLDRMSLGDRCDSSASHLDDRRTLVGREHQALATKIANKQLRKTFAARGTSQDDDEGSESLSRMMVAARQRGERSALERNGANLAEAQPQPARSSAYRYPTIPQKTAQQPERGLARPPTPPRKERDPAKDGVHWQVGGPMRHQPPQRPPKERISTSSSPPPIPAKLAELDAYEPASRSLTSTPDLNPRKYNFKASATLENGQRLRTIFISPNLRSRFLSIAAPNTQRNLETLGILCGKLISNAFFISSLVIPDQTSTSDTCDMEDEAALVDYCEEKDMMTLGWIHTHPTQTCFMSSRDLHTHGGYQMQMAESIAIVCAPSREPSWGVFRLTNPPGLPVVMSCKQTGIFHPHAEPNVYTDAMKPGHVVELPGLEFEVVDLRRKKP